MESLHESRCHRRPEEITTDIGAMVNLVKKKAISRVPYVAEYVKSMKDAIR